MALLRLDPNKLELTIQVGVLEKYNPDKEIKSIYKEIDGLKKKLENNAKKIIGNFKGLEQYDKELEKDKEKEEKWKKYVSDTYMPELKKVIGKIEEKNKKICPNYGEVFSA